jgi:hypothetical protein
VALGAVGLDDWKNVVLISDLVLSARGKGEQQNRRKADGKAQPGRKHIGNG